MLKFDRIIKTFQESVPPILRTHKFRYHSRYRLSNKEICKYYICDACNSEVTLNFYKRGNKWRMCQARFYIGDNDAKIGDEILKCSVILMRKACE